MEKLLTPLSDERRKHLDERQWDEMPKKQPPGKRYRTLRQRDRDRVLYCAALQRLAYVTQVTAPESGHTFHNRLSHTLKVAQVGRRNAERLQHLVEEKQIVGAAATLVEGVDPDGVETACLAHDLGHPPFGHIAERILNEIAMSELPDGFEGNAQSFRIVTRLAVAGMYTGLNLTSGTLDGMLKYPWRYRPEDRVGHGRRKRKWGYYQDDDLAYAFAREHLPADTKAAVPERSFEAELMDWADDLTYAVHDMDDFFRAGLIPLDRLGDGNTPEFKRMVELLTDFSESDPGAFPDYEVDALAEAARSAISRNAVPGPYEHTIDARMAMRKFGSDLITRYLEAFSVEDDPKTKQIKMQIDDDCRREVEALKVLVTVFVVQRPGLAVVQHGQQRVIEELFGWYFKASAKDRRLFPPGVKERLDQTDGSASQRTRVVVDFIAGLTETSAIQLYRRLSGGWSAPTLDATALMG